MTAQNGTQARPANAQPSWHALEAAGALSVLASDATRGLSRAEVEQRRAQFGPNALPEAKRRSPLFVLLHQFKSPLIYLLLAAAGLAFAASEVSDGVVILVVVLLNAFIGAFQEGRAERALVALRQMAGLKARVVRDGRETELDARDLVPGDVLVLVAGDAVGADGRILNDAALQVAEAALTGESVPVSKGDRPVDPDAPVADRTNMVFAGTHVTAGRAAAVVVATGLTTEIGRISSLAESATAPKTPLERRIDQFGHYVMVAAAIIFVLILGVGYLRGIPLSEIAMIGISQVVGMVPEGLPVAMTVALAVGVQRMARRRAIVRRLSAVETLGSTTVICSDKTGTLTRNEMTVTDVFLAGRGKVSVSGIGYAPSGAFTEDDREVDPKRDPQLRALLEAGLLCNDAQVLGPDSQNTQWRTTGDPTEAALVTLGQKGGLVAEELRRRQPRRAELPFDPDDKMMATEHEVSGRRVIFLKGAPEAVLELCGRVRSKDGVRLFDESERQLVRQAVDAMGQEALRVLAVATVDDASLDQRGRFSGLLGRATLLGLVGQLDPPRTEVAAAVESCRQAGIRPVMVTGDHKATGLAVARTLGIAHDGDLALDGKELSALSEEELAARLDRISVFARVHPAQKLRIVEAYQKRRDVVAMTGDGVNDAPALVRADVGVAMGITGTEVAKEAAKIIVTDDNFASIVSAVEEGRVVYRNIKKAILFLLATSFAEVLVLLLSLILGFPPPFSAVQILWNNLVTEGVITINLIMDPAEGDEMQRRPIDSGEPLLSKALLLRMSFMTPAIVVSTLGWFVYRLSQGAPASVAQTETFTLLAVCEWFNVLNCRSETHSALSLGLLKNKWLLGGLVVGNLLQVAVIFWSPLSGLFHTTPIGLEQVVAIGVVGSLVLWVEELRKLVWRLRARRAGSVLVSPHD